MPGFGANTVPLILVPLAAVFVWVAIWQVWLPRPGGSSRVTRVVTTVDANAGSLPTHKVTRVVSTAAQASPSRRSETLALALLFLGAGIAVVGVFHNRIGTIELDKDGVKISLTKDEQAGAAELVDRLAQTGVGPRTYGGALRRYLDSVAARRPGAAGPGPDATVKGLTAPGLTAAQASALAQRIADEPV